MNWYHLSFAPRMNGLRLMHVHPMDPNERTVPGDVMAAIEQKYGPIGYPTHGEEWAAEDAVFGWPLLD